ncbi:MAG: DUF5668 domain-containing protein [Candidatus Zixiibacteriota bacterium]
MSKSERQRRGGKVFWGLVLILAGALILLDNLGYLRHDIIRFWPVLVIIWGIKKLFD